LNIFPESERCSHGGNAASSPESKATLVTKSIPNPGGNGAIRYKLEYFLDEEMCYLVAMNANINFKGVIAAQAFFAKRLKQARLDELKYESNQWEWMYESPKK
jgi:hypothetical protein